MKTLVALFTFITIITSNTPMIDFGNQKTNQWKSNLTDQKQVSAATVSYSEETVRLIGYKETNEEVSPSLFGPELDFNLSDYENVEIKFRAKGAAVSMLMQIDLEFGSKQFIYPFKDVSGEWQTLQIPIQEFIDLSSNNLKAISKKEIKNINRLGFMTSNDFTGPYALEVDYISFN